MLLDGQGTNTAAEEAFNSQIEGLIILLYDSIVLKCSRAPELALAGRALLSGLCPREALLAQSSQRSHAEPQPRGGRSVRAGASSTPRPGLWARGPGCGSWARMAFWQASAQPS